MSDVGFKSPGTCKLTLLVMKWLEVSSDEQLDNCWYARLVFKELEEVMGLFQGWAGGSRRLLALMSMSGCRIRWVAVSGGCQGWNRPKGPLASGRIIKP
jgi:hypothetical protein